MARKNNEFPVEKIGCGPMTHLCGVASICCIVIWRTKTIAYNLHILLNYIIHFESMQPTVFLCFHLQKKQKRKHHISVLPPLFTFRATPHKSARESDERICVRKRWKTAGILCVLQGFPNAFLAERIRQNPQTHLCSVALGQYRINWRRGFSRRFCAGKRQFFAGILCVWQEKITNFRQNVSSKGRRYACAVLP